MKPILYYFSWDILILMFQKKIWALSKEIDFAVERHKALLQEKEEERQRKLDSKLKPKGHHVLKSKN